ncbi:MAG: hypothetical protein EPO32_14360 [Anaerolineae bacterium]|nr:MAG: hypothetical protein EPO32_14360 [Anaerolineae bacterium]
MTLLQQGLIISALGISLTFAALVVVIGLILLLRALFPATAPSLRLAASPVHESAERERSAAILAAVWYVRNHMQPARPTDPALGHRLESPPGGYWRAAPGLDEQ